MPAACHKPPLKRPWTATRRRWPQCGRLSQRHDYFIPALNEIDGFECRRGEGAFYAFPQVGGALAALGLESDISLVELLLKEADVACVPGSAFGAPQHLRLSFACSMQTLEEGMKRIKRVVAA